MTYTKTEIKAPSSDGIHTLRGYIYIPDGIPKGIFHIVHGMTEHIGRYDFLMKYYAEQGYIVAGYDNLGHGRTVRRSDLGFIAPKKGYKYLVDDVHIFGEKLRKNHKGLPYILMGHSMGSFIVRLAAEKYPEDIDKLIICGSGGPNPLAPFGLILIDLLIPFKGKRGYSKKISKMVFGSYNKGFNEVSHSAWLSKDDEYKEKRLTDPYCNFHFTLSAMHDLIKLNYLSNLGKWYKNYKKDLPTLIISGEKDPVGEHGKGITKVYDRLISKGAKDITFKLYKDCRHEIHNDTCREEVEADILSFISRTDTKETKEENV